MRRRHGGAAMLLALLLMALASTLAAALLQQQALALALEEAEGSRAQSGWVLAGAADWARLILREDARSGRVDHLGEPWATPLAEARLSSFLAMDRESGSEPETEAFLSGQISDAQSRYNLRNLVDEEGRLVAAEQATLVRLCASRGLSPELAQRLAAALAASWGQAPQRPLAVSRFEHLAWLGIEAEALAALRPLVDVLPQRSPLNLNTAAAEAVAAVLGIDAASAESVVQARRLQALASLDQARLQLPPGTTLDPKRVAVESAYFEVRGRLRLGDRAVQERTLVHRRGATEVVVLWRRREGAWADMP